MSIHDFKWTKPTLQYKEDKNGLPVGLSVENWIAPPPPTDHVLNGTTCSAVPFKLHAHAEDLFNAFLLDTAEHNWTYLPYGPFDSLDKFINWCEATCVGDDPFFYSIIDNNTGKAAGLASYLRITPDAGSIEVGHIHFSPIIQRKKIATEAMYLMMQNVFDTLGYRRYEWKCNALNKPSCQAAERLGFQFEGIFRQATLSKGQNRDTAWFSILDSEWANLKTGFQHWLSDQNFDSSGDQKQTLQNCLKSAHT